MTSWPSSAAAGMRQELTDVQRVVPSASGRATMIAHAPHSPSAQPSLAAVRPWSRKKSRAFWCGGPSKLRVCPLTETCVAERNVVEDIAPNLLCLRGETQYAWLEYVFCSSKLLDIHANSSEEHRVQRDKERSRTPMLTPRGRSAPFAKLCSYSHYSRSQHSRYWSTNKVEDESSRYDPQQPVDFTTTLTHRVDHGPRDETNTDAEIGRASCR